MVTPAQKQPADPEVASEINYGPLPERVGYRLKRAHAYSIQTWDALFADQSLPYGQYSILLVISLNPGLSQLRVAEAVGLDGSTVVPITNRFVSLGWIRRVRRRNDRRTYSLRVTPEGQALLNRVRAILLAHDEDLVSPLTARERATLFQLLVKITDGRGAGMEAKHKS
jgi:DNA-binding MarR family transcriptional regulator